MEDYKTELRIQQREKEIWARMAERRAERTVRVAVQAMTSQPLFRSSNSNSDFATSCPRTATISNVSRNVIATQPASEPQKTKVELLHGLYQLVEERGRMLDEILVGMREQQRSMSTLPFRTTSSFSRVTKKS
jgi:hypothetical protein